jgi:hypothetical protein
MRDLLKSLPNTKNHKKGKGPFFLWPKGGVEDKGIRFKVLKKGWRFKYDVQMVGGWKLEVKFKIRFEDDCRPIFNDLKI